MPTRINRAIELLAADQAIYYVGNHTGHVLTHAQGREDGGTWADYINVGMEHGAFDMTGLGEYMAGLFYRAEGRLRHREIDGRWKAISSSRKSLRVSEAAAPSS